MGDEPRGQTTAPPRRRARSGPATIYDIAELAGVNPSTVSRALGRPGRVSAATEARIRAAADELNFHVNPMARALPTGKTSTLALVVADITNPMIFGVVRGAEQAAAAAGYTLVIAESQESGAAEVATIEQLMPSVDGIVLATTRLAPEVIAGIASRKPVVLINNAVDGVASILPDVERGVRDLVEHLHGLGHRSLAYLSGPATSWISARRWEAILEAAESLGVGAVEIGPGQPTIEGGRDAFRRIQAARVSAVVAFNDLMAIGVHQVARERGVVVPDDLSIVGFDDIFGAELVTPPLTTVRAPLVLAGEHAVRALLGAEPALVSEPLATELVVRGSTGRASH